ncbi:macrolide transport system ATP-binding/permease protein [Paenibacillus algorifonticola]|uniref:Macrolide transport system ATP-binding/permease protein n=1 Tax=Paenibacillus algorifonticola TaxID=684063 RepID=A0A1I2A187_9BACL|nr:ABC-F family ATP-binding cassette domain-containing protein [Paenibacillus algorifonticola]SFE37537.1 macrolide transport system ATP-binding/permease protein [Paenibacillus algorifonticola]
MGKLELRHIEIAVQDRLLGKLDGVWELGDRDRVGIIGVNGAGKSTLLAVLAGRVEPDKGTVTRSGSVAELRQAAGYRGEAAADEQAEQRPSDVLSDEHELQEEAILRSRHSEGESASRWQALDAEEAEAFGSGGEKTRTAIAELFASGAEILFADEPTSHLDAAGIRQLEEAFAAYPGAVIFVSHDRELLDLVCTSIIELEDGKILIFKGNYSAYKREKEAMRAREAFEYEQYAKEKSRLLDSLAKVRQSAKSISHKPKRMSYKEANLGLEGMRSSQAKLNRTAEALESRLERLEVKQKPAELQMPLFDAQVHEPCRSKHVLRLERLEAGLSDDRWLFRELSVQMKPGMRVALVGGNGAGKTTLLRSIYEQAQGVVAAPSCRMGYFRQDLSLLDESKSVLHNVLASAVYPDAHVRTVLARTLFKGEDVFKQVALLSGGERVKAALAKLLLGQHNTLLLDEPSNYLDIYAREQLEETLRAYPGTIIFASHDRRLVSRAATHTLQLLGDGEWRFSENEAVDDGGAAADKSAAAGTGAAQASVEREELRLKLEREFAETLALLSLPQRSAEDKAALELKFSELVAQRRDLRL